MEQCIVLMSCNNLYVRACVRVWMYVLTIQNIAVNKIRKIAYDWMYLKENRETSKDG